MICLSSSGSTALATNEVLGAFAAIGAPVHMELLEEIPDTVLEGSDEIPDKHGVKSCIANA